MFINKNMFHNNLLLREYLNTSLNNSLKRIINKERINININSQTSNKDFYEKKNTIIVVSYLSMLYFLYNIYKNIKI
jgi:hypothetical protein